MGRWIWAVSVVVALIAIVAVDKQSLDREHRPTTRDKVERERGV